MKFYIYTFLFSIAISNVYAQTTTFNNNLSVSSIAQSNTANSQTLTPTNSNETSVVLTEKTLVKTFNIQNNNTVVLDLDGKVEVKEWSENTVRIQMNIKLGNSTVHLLKYLITKGRYNLESENTTDGFSISAPGRSQAVVINKAGDLLNELVTYTVFVPRNVTVEMTDNTATTTATDVEDK